MKEITTILQYPRARAIQLPIVISCFTSDTSLPFLLVTCYIMFLIEFKSIFPFNYIITNSLKSIKIFRMAVEKEHRGIPKAIFLEDVDSYMSSTTPEKVAADVLKDFDEQLQKYKYMELNLMQRKKRLRAQVPDIEKTLEIVQHMLLKKVEFKTHFMLSDQVHAVATVPPTDEVFLWLGANVMLEYTIEEAVTLLTKNLNTATVNADQLEDDLGYLSNQITTMEVNMARVYNWDFKRRKAAGPKA